MPKDTLNRLNGEKAYALNKFLEPRTASYTMECPNYGDVAAEAAKALGFTVTAPNIVSAFKALKIPRKRMHEPKRPRATKGRGEPRPTAEHMRAVVASLIELREEFGWSSGSLQKVLHELDEQTGSAQGMLIKP